MPGAEKQQADCLADLTTAATSTNGHTDPADYAGLHAAGTKNPTGVPGIQIDGYFPDTSMFNTHHGWNHDSQFVIRIPDNWNGGLVVTGAPGNRTQYAHDYIIGDTVLAKGYAFASTDKGNSGLEFYTDGVDPGDAVAEWNTRVTQLTRAAQAVVKQRYATPLQHTYMFGISNGGYLVRWQLENHPELYSGGIDWEGTLFTWEQNPTRYLPTALRNYPAYAETGDQAAHAAMVDAGFEPGSEYLWPFHNQVYWGLTQKIYRSEFDPAYTGSDADYNLDTRPQSVRNAISKVALTGRIGKPMLTLHGDHDSLLPIRVDSDYYDAMIERAGRGDLHRYYRIQNGNHVDGLYASFPDRVRPILPCARTAFDALEAWVNRGTLPPADATLPKPSGDLLNTCGLG